ncbi:MAG: VOC family protein [Magnetococcales bacterium]|nr:VOC family protein [Magnetococcales bacterium]
MADIQLTFHHLGLATPTPEEAQRFLTGLGYRFGETIWDPLQKVHLSWGRSEVMPDVEIISPGEEPSPIDALIKKNRSHIYHTCYEVASIEAAVAELEAAGNRLLPLAPPKPAILFDHRLVAFFMVAGFGVIELLQCTDPA